MSHIRKSAVEGLTIGDTFTVTRTLTEADTIAFAEISRDYNPIHFDERFAAVKHFRGRICHGLLVASLLTEIGGQIGWLASGMGFRFRKPVYFGDTVECRFTLTKMDDRHRAEAEAVFRNQQGEIVLEATLSGILPGPAEKEVIGRMMAEGDPTNPLY